MESGESPTASRSTGWFPPTAEFIGQRQENFMTLWNFMQILPISDWECSWDILKLGQSYIFCMNTSCPGHCYEPNSVFARFASREVSMIMFGWDSLWLFVIYTCLVLGLSWDHPLLLQLVGLHFSSEVSDGVTHSWKSEATSLTPQNPNTKRAARIPAKFFQPNGPTLKKTHHYMASLAHQTNS